MAVGAFDNFLHIVYSKPGTIEDMAVRDRPGLALIPKGQADGTTTGYPFKIGPPQGMASARADAQLVSAFPTTNGSNSIVGEWLMTNGRYSPTVEIDDKQMDESEASGGAAYARKFITETDGLIESFGDQMDTYVYGEPGRSLCQAAVTATGICTVNLLEDINFIFVGMALVGSLNNGGTAGHATVAGIGYVISVNRDAGTFVVSTTAGGAAGNPGAVWQGQTLFLFRAGDFGAGGVAVVDTGATGTQVGQQILETLSDWIPSAVAGTTFKTVVRSLDSRLEGVRLTATEATNAGSIEGRLKQAVVKLNQTSGMHGALTWVVESQQWQAIADILESRSQTSIVERKYEGKSGREGTFGYSALRLATNAGMCDIISDAHVKHTTGWGLNLKHVKINTIGGFPAVFKGDGMKMLRKATSDRYEFRLKMYGHLVMPYPSFSVRTPLAAIT